MTEEVGRMRGGERSIESSISPADRKRLEKVREDWYARIAGADISLLLQAVKNDLTSRAVDAHKKANPDKKLSREDIVSFRIAISPANVILATKELLSNVLLKEQHNAQLSGKTKQERMYRPDVATLSDAVRDLTEQAAKKFLKTKSATFLLDHHRQATAQRIREMAGKEALLKPVEFIAETGNPAYYVGKLFYRGSFNKVSILEKNCVGTEDDYFENSKVNPETGRPVTEIFVVMKRWELATPKEREETAARLLEDEKVVETIMNQILQTQSALGADEGYKTPGDLVRAVGETGDIIEVESLNSKRLAAIDLLYGAISRVLNKDVPLLNAHLDSHHGRKYLVSAISKLPQFTDIPEITIEYDVDRNAIDQVKARVKGKPDRPLARDDERKGVVLSALWEIARSERINQKTGEKERRRVLAVTDLENVFRTSDNERIMLVKEGNTITSITNPDKGWGRNTYWRIKELVEALKSRNSAKDFELLGGFISIDEKTPMEILDALHDLSADVQIRASATQEQLDRIVRVNGVLRVVESRNPDRVHLRNLLFAGALDIRDVRGFRADKLQEVETYLRSNAESNYLKSLERASVVELEPGGHYQSRPLIFVAPKLTGTEVVLHNNRKFSRYDCPVQCKIELR